MRNLGKFFSVLVGTSAVALFLYSFTFSSPEFSYSQSVVSRQEEIVKKKEARHLKPPEPLRGIYMTQCVATMPSFRDKLVQLTDETELNTIIIDIKDYTGTVSFSSGNSQIDSLNESGKGCKVSDMREFIEKLHEKNIYVIGRITVFQDPLYTKAYPEFAIKRKSNGEVWKDRKGLSFVDVGAKPFWDYILAIATSSYAIGFDEINFDYIRFPSDGDMKDINFTHTGTTTKKEMLRQFFEYIDEKIAGTGIVTSADLFGMTTTNTDDLNIGQILEYALLYFDYVAPMVYPSHYPPKFNGWPDPNKVPYEIVRFSMESAVARANFLRKETVSKMYSQVASSTEMKKNSFYNERLEKRLGHLQLRPWLQDNDYPIHYTPEMVRKQIQATYDAGLTSWMLWDPSNTYTYEALLLDVAPARP